MNKIIGPYFAIGDIHGCHHELTLLLDELPLKADTTLIFLGDYIDRGPQSKGVVETILELKKNYTVITLMGNHEDMLLSYLRDPQSIHGANFVYNGGAATLASYSTIEDKFHIPDEHIEFFNSLDLYFETEDYFFVHAGVPDISLAELKLTSIEHYDTLLWIREKFLGSNFQWEKKIVHGHTPVREVEITGRRINLDTGCVYNNGLTAMEFPSQKIYSVPKRKKTEHIFLKNISELERRRAFRFHGQIPIIIWKDGQTIPFSTINYSDLGLLLFDTDEKTLLQEGEVVKGEIRPDEDEKNHFKFQGKVVRVERKNERNYYGIDFVETPFASLHLVLSSTKIPKK